MKKRSVLYSPSRLLLFFVVAFTALSLTLSAGAFAKEAKQAKETKAAAETKETKAAKETKTTKEAAAPVDINSASQKDLESLKGVGPATAKKIIENRPYKSVDELSKAGLSAKKIADLKPFVKAGPAAAAPQPPKTEAKPAKAPADKPAAATPAAPKAETKPAAAPQPAKAETKPAKASADKPAAPSKLAPGEKVNINTATKEKLEALPEIGPVKAQAIIDGRPYKTPEDVMKVKGIKQGTFDKIKDTITVK